MIAAAYVYQPTLYFAVYLPFVVPRLPGWTHVPLPVHVAVVGGFVTVLLVAGRSLGHRGIALHALGIVVANSVFTYTMAALRMPAFLKSHEAYGDAWVANFLWDVGGAVVAMPGIMAVLEAGRALNRVMRARRSPA